MGGGLLVGLNNEDAAKFGFLLATPIIGAAAALKLPELFGKDGDGVRGPALVAALCAAITAYLSVRFLMKYFETNRLTPFAIYCVVVGAALTIGFAVHPEHDQAQHSLIIPAVILGIVLIVIAIIYWTSTASGLPSFFPGHQAGSSTHHVKHGIAAFLLGLACLVFAWFQTGPAQRAAKPER